MMPIRKPRRNYEELLEDAVVDLFCGAGYLAWRQVPCEAGRADVVTRDTIFELKHRLTRTSFHSAMGQLLSYRAYLNRSARLAIICNESSVPALHEVGRRCGVDVYLWEELKRDPGCILRSPPYARPPS